MRAGPWSFVGSCIYAPPLGEGVSRGDFFVDCFSEDAARKLVAVLNEQQRAIPERRVRSARKPKGLPPSVERYFARIRKLPCVASDRSACNGDGATAEVSHVVTGAGQKGVGQKAPHSQVVPHCHLHHRQWDTHTGPFAGWKKERRYDEAKAWLDRTHTMLEMGIA
jgi:hypothetical protein